MEYGMQLFTALNATGMKAPAQNTGNESISTTRIRYWLKISRDESQGMVICRFFRCRALIDFQHAFQSDARKVGRLTIYLNRVHDIARD